MSSNTSGSAATPVKPGTPGQPRPSTGFGLGLCAQRCIGTAPSAATSPRPAHHPFTILLHDGGVLVGGLSEAETLVRAAYARGTWVDLRTGDAQADDMGHAGGWDGSRSVRAEVITGLLRGAYDPQPGVTPALRLRVRITGRLDLMGTDVGAPLICEHCVFDEEPRFVEARTRTIRLIDSRMPGFNGARLRVDGLLYLGDSSIEGTLRLDRAVVTGEVSLRGLSVGTDPRGVAVAADALCVEGPLECNSGFRSTGSVRLRGTRIGSLFDISDASFHAIGSHALRAGNITVDGNLRADRLVVDGGARLSNARVGGYLSLNGARLSNPGRTALAAGGIRIAGGLWCEDGFQAEGEVRLISGEFSATMTGARLAHRGGVALRADQAVIGAFSGGGLAVDGGEVSFAHARIASRLTLSGARLDAAAGEVALRADGITVEGLLDLGGLEAQGEISMRTGRLGGRMIVDGAVLDNPGGVALRLSGAQINGDLLCDGLTAQGTVKLTGASIGSIVSLTTMRLSNPGDTALDLASLQAPLVALQPAQAVEGAVDLRHARLGRLIDDPDYWPHTLLLDGLTYTALEPSLPAGARLEWLRRDPGGFQPGPYEQLAAHYTATGRPDQARRVLLAKERRHRSTMAPIGRIWSLLQDITVAYGYQPWRAALWLLALLAGGSLLYHRYPPPALSPGGAPHFNAVVYALDLLLPLVDLGQKHAFNPAGVMQWFSYVLVAAGWVLATTIAAGVARVIRRG